MSDAPQAPQAGTFVWNELTTPDPEAAKAFFSSLLGWTYSPFGDSYTMIAHGAKNIGGMMKMDGPSWEGIPPHWMTYVAVDDVDASAVRVAELGGKVCVPPSDIPDVGRFCVINDPTGATLSLITFKAPG